MPHTPTPPAGDSTHWLPPSPEELQALLPQYEISALIGKGGMGAVYRGRQVHLDRAVAIKILPPGLDETDATFSERFRNEALAMAKLNHPGLVAVYDFGKTPNGMLYIVMEFVDGTDVAHMMAKTGRLSSEHAMAITAHVCDALKYAHDRGIVHRDIKPANIMVGYDGVVKVADFGLAKMNQGGQSEGLTQSGLAMGTMHYIAPEALILGGSVDQRADIYAMGVMLYHMLTGGLPHGMFELPSLQVPGLDPRYDGIISRALRNDRDRRYQSVRELRHDLDAIITRPVVQVNADAAKAPAALNTTARPQRPAGTPQRSAAQPQRSAAQPQRTPQPPPRPKSNLGFWIPVVGVVAALVAAFVWLAHPERKTIQRIEGEAMKVVVTGGDAAPQRTTAFHAGVWSGDSQLWWHGGKLGDLLTVEFPVTEPGKQRIKGVLTGAADYAVVAVLVDGRPVPGPPVDLQAEGIVISDILDWGVFDLKAGTHKLEFKLVGNHGIARRDIVPFGFGLDYIQLEPPIVRTTPATPGTNVALTARPSASACCSWDDVKNLNSGKETPGRKSNDETHDRFTWFSRKGGMEWAQYEWETPQDIHECSVFWYADSDITSNGCKLPAFWRLLYREASGAWVPVEATMPDAVSDDWNTVTFPAVKTTALRISVQCQEGWSAGIRHWKAIAADPAATVSDPKHKAHPALFLGDLSPLHYHVGWEIYGTKIPSERYLNDGNYLTVAGKPCSQFLWAHANSRLEFAIPEGYTHFAATGIGFRNDRPSASNIGLNTWTYAVEVDGKTIFSSEELNTYPNNELPVDLAFPAGSKRLTLLIDNCGNGNSDHSFWAYPTLSVDGASIAPKSTPVTANTAPAAPSRPVPRPLAAVKAATGSSLPRGYLRGESFSMFNGRDLTGWNGLTQFWSVQDGAITMKSTADNHPTANTSLVWKSEVKDFEFSCKFKFISGDSKAWRISGIQFRSRLQDRATYSLAGYNADLDYDWRFTGGLVEKFGRELPTKRGEMMLLKDSGNPRKPTSEIVDSFGTADDIGKRIKREDWSDYKIVAAGKRIQLFVNGFPTIDVIDETQEAAKSGLLALSNFYGSVMTVQFKDLQFTELKPDAAEEAAAAARATATKLKIRRFTDRCPEALKHVLAPLDEDIDPTLRPSLVSMQDELIAEGRSQPAASLNAYRAAHALCVALLSAVDERAAASSEPTWAARAQALRPVLEDLHAKAHQLLSTVP